MGRVARSPISTNAVPPLCTVLSINTTYTLSGTATGGSYCYGFQVTQRAKTQVFLTGQNASTNFALTLIRHNDDDTANFNWRWNGSTTVNTSSAVSNSAGVASGVANLGTCSGANMVVETTAGQTWRTYFDIGAWDLKVTGANPNDVGVGGPNFPNVSLGHICTQTFLP